MYTIFPKNGIQVDMYKLLGEGRNFEIIKCWHFRD